MCYSSWLRVLEEGVEGLDGGNAVHGCSGVGGH